MRLDVEFPRLAASALHSGGQAKRFRIGKRYRGHRRRRARAPARARGPAAQQDQSRRRRALAPHRPGRTTCEGYGPEAWTLDYHIRQDELANDYWRTRVLRPSYNQLYPPEKGQPHTLVEVRYPPANRAKDDPELLDLLRQNDPRLSQLRAANEILAKSVTFVVDGQSQKSVAASDIDFLKPALRAVAPPEAQLTMALCGFRQRVSMGSATAQIRRSSSHGDNAARAGSAFAACTNPEH